MARRINLSQIGNFSQEKYEQLLRAVVFETELRLKMASPVDTGRFRGSWVTAENQTGSYDSGEFQKATGAWRNATKPPSDPKLERRVSIGYQAGQERAGNTYHISNNLPYAEKLAYAKIGEGGSTQAPAGWTDLIAREMTDWARQTANQIGRQD